MAKQVSRIRTATNSVLDGASSILAFIPGLAERLLGVVQAGIGVLDRIVTAANDFFGVIREKLDTLEEFLRAYPNKS